jgi:hypothetical protein
MIAKIAGLAAEVIALRLTEWSAARQTADPDEWSSEQWPLAVRFQADSFAGRLRTHALDLPIVCFIEWVDLWSMGDAYRRWLTPPDSPGPWTVHSDRYEIYAYALPHGGLLSDHLSSAGPQQWEESDWFIGRLSGAIATCRQIVNRSTLIVVREVVGGLATDEDIAASLSHLPNWLPID